MESFCEYLGRDLGYRVTQSGRLAGGAGGQWRVRVVLPTFSYLMSLEMHQIDFHHRQTERREFIYKIYSSVENRQISGIYI